VVSKRILSIKKSSDFQRLKASGRKLKLTSWLLINFTENDSKGLRLGLTIQKKVGSAVIRNRLKRKIREEIRVLLKTGRARSIDINFIVLPQKDPEFFKLLNNESFIEAFRNLGKVILEPS